VSVYLCVSDDRLLVRGVTADDAGVYQCFVSNAAGTVSALATVTVRPQQPLDLQHIAPDGMGLQSFSTISLQVFFGLPLGLALSTSYSIHFLTQSLSSFHSTFLYHHTCFAIVPRLCHLILVSLSTLYLELGTGVTWFLVTCNFTPHIHLTILISAL